MIVLGSLAIAGVRCLFSVIRFPLTPDFDSRFQFRYRRTRENLGGGSERRSSEKRKFCGYTRHTSRPKVVRAGNFGSGCRLGLHKPGMINAAVKCTRMRQWNGICGTRNFICLFSPNSAPCGQCDRDCCDAKCHEGSEKHTEACALICQKYHKKY